MGNSEISIKVNNLSKTYKSGFSGDGVKALVDVSLDINQGEIFGLLGPNGAGKTTLLKILLGSLQPTSGTALINGIDIGRPEARGKTGFLPENHRFPSYLTGMQMMVVFGGMSGMTAREVITEATPLLDLVGMLKWQNTQIKKYSKGMMQRLGLAQALLNDPDLIFLDEPTDGVDPIGRHEIRNILLELKNRGKTVFLNSHLLSEVESISDRVAILDRGKLLKVGPVSGLTQTKPEVTITISTITADKQNVITDQYPTAQVTGSRVVAPFTEPSEVNSLIDLLRANGIDILTITQVTPSLEDSFVSLIKGSGVGGVGGVGGGTGGEHE